MNLYFAMGCTTSDVASIVSRCELLNGDHNVIILSFAKRESDVAASLDLNPARVRGVDKV